MNVLLFFLKKIDKYKGEKKVAEERFALIGRVYTLLKNEEKRRIFDGRLRAKMAMEVRRGQENDLTRKLKEKLRHREDEAKSCMVVKRQKKDDDDDARRRSADVIAQIRGAARRARSVASITAAATFQRTKSTSSTSTDGASYNDPSSSFDGRRTASISAPRPPLPSSSGDDDYELETLRRLSSAQALRRAASTTTAPSNAATSIANFNVPTAS